jgi:hypothetical protein
MNASKFRAVLLRPAQLSMRRRLSRTADLGMQPSEPSMAPVESESDSQNSPPDAEKKTTATKRQANALSTWENEGGTTHERS